MMYKNFEDYLFTACMAENPHLLDDDFPDAFNEWLTDDLSADDWLAYGDKYAKIHAEEVLKQLAKGLGQ